MTWLTTDKCTLCLKIFCDVKINMVSDLVRQREYIGF